MNLLEIRDKVQRWILDMGIEGLEVTQGGALSFRFGSTRVFVKVLEMGDEEDRWHMLSVFAPMLLNLKPSPELFEYVARNADRWYFGHLGLIEEDDDTLTLVFAYRVLADYLDPEELKYAISGVAGTASREDDDLAERFGGDVFYDDEEQE